MENRAFEGESSGGNPPKVPKDDPPGPSNSRADLSGESKDQAKAVIPTLARIPDDEDDDSPPAYVRRYLPQEKKTDDLEGLEPPLPETVQEPRDARLDPELERQASKRREMRRIQNLTEGPCSLRPNSPNQTPLSTPDIGGELADAPDPGQQLANAPDPAEQVANTTTRPATWRERCVSYYKRINAFSFQFPFHTLLLTWPLSTVVMGILNDYYCHMNNYLPYVMMVVGLLGFATGLVRLFGIYCDKRLTFIRTRNLWIGVRTAEFVTWMVFVFQLYCFFENSPSFTPGAESYCKPKFYKINCGLMFLASSTMIGWIIVNVGNFIYWFPRRNEGSSA